jgi:transmembrane sensor
VINKRQPKFTKITVRPHEKLLINKTDNAFEKSASADLVTRPDATLPPGYDVQSLPKNIPDTSLVETSWVYGKLLFDEENTFREEAEKMERWFNVRISFTSEKVANYNLHGSFTIENIDQVLEGLKLIAPFNYKIKNNEVEIGK